MIEMNYIRQGGIAMLIAVSVLAGCKKKDSVAPAAQDASAQILTDFSSKVAFADYTDLAGQTAGMDSAVQAFIQSPAEAKLNEVRRYWFSSRQAYEQSEAFIFGPYLGPLDPEMDSWPVNKNDMDSLLSGKHALDSAYLGTLPFTLKGFHALEYLIFGAGGNRSYSGYTAREKEYMSALAINLQKTAVKMKNAWNPADKNSFGWQIANAGSAGNSQYTSRALAMEEIVNSMADIVEEVGEEKMKVPFEQKDSLLEESHFSRNSFADFANNMRGVKNAYMGRYSASGTGLTSLVNTYNKSLDATLQQQMDNAINVFTSFSMPFGEAIYTQPGGIQNAQAVLRQLHDTIEDQLLPLVKAHVQ